MLWCRLHAIIGMLFCLGAVLEESVVLALVSIAFAIIFVGYVLLERSE